MDFVRKPAVAGTWYPGTREALTDAVDAFLQAVGATSDLRQLKAVVAPHAGLAYSGMVAAHAYRELARREVELLLLVGPSHFVRFEGVAVCRGSGFDTPLGVAEIDETCVGDLLDASPLVHDLPGPHVREHSLEMQLPFVKRVAPAARIVPLLMGRQTPETVVALGSALASVLMHREGLLVASTDLSHYHDARTAAQLDEVVIEHLTNFDADGLQRTLVQKPEHACGGGPLVAVMRAAQALGARDARVLSYADSGDVSGDKTAVVGYVAAAMGVA